MRICQAPSMVVNYPRVVRGPVASGQECSSQDHFQRSTAEQKQQIPSQGILNERRIPIEYNHVRQTEQEQDEEPPSVKWKKPHATSFGTIHLKGETPAEEERKQGMKFSSGKEVQQRIGSPVRSPRPERSEERRVGKECRSRRSP